MTIGGGPLKVFCSYRSVDRERVEEFARRLRESGVVAWLDLWEIAAGDDIVARMDEGIDGCDASLIFISEAWFDGLWVRDEYTSLFLRKVEDGIRVIPVLLGDDSSRLRRLLPSRLRKSASRSVGDFDSIRDALLGVDRRPGVADALRSPVMAMRLTLTEVGGAVRTTLEMDGQVRATAESARPRAAHALDGRRADS